MRKLWLVTVLAILLAGCGLGGPDIDQTSFWGQEDALKSRDLVATITGLKMGRETTILMKPPFYSGPMPLKLDELVCMSPGFMGLGSNIVLVQDFGEWRNIFIYIDRMAVLNSMPAGAISVENRSNFRVAQCKVIRPLTAKDNQLTGFEIEEVQHADDGRIQFRGRFEVDFHLGFKTRQLSSVGRRIKEFYFVWPRAF
jgi:hypothetical protein